MFSLSLPPESSGEVSLLGLCTCDEEQLSCASANLFSSRGAKRERSAGFQLPYKRACHARVGGVAENRGPELSFGINLAPWTPSFLGTGPEQLVRDAEVCTVT